MGDDGVGFWLRLFKSKKKFKRIIFEAFLIFFEIRSKNKSCHSALFFGILPEYEDKKISNQVGNKMPVSLTNEDVPINPYDWALGEPDWTTRLRPEATERSRRVNPVLCRHPGQVDQGKNNSWVLLKEGDTNFGVRTFLVMQGVAEIASSVGQDRNGGEVFNVASLKLQAFWVVMTSLMRVENTNIQQIRYIQMKE